MIGMCQRPMASHLDSNALLLGGYAVSTQRKYMAAVGRFASWCDIHGVVLRGTSSTDYHLSRYMIDLWFNGRGKVDASCVLYGLDMLVPGVRTRLILSRRSLRGFNRLAPSVPRPPMPWPVAVAIAMWLAQHGRVQFAVGVLLSFDCYLRIGELMGLIREDIAFGCDPRLGVDHDNRVHIHLRVTKTGANKGVEVANGDIKVLLAKLIESIPHGGRIITSHESTFRRWFDRAVVSLGLSCDYTPHCLRHGGATFDKLNGMNINDIMHRGRWAHHKSAVHYIQQGAQLMMMQSVPLIVDYIGRTAAKSLAVSIILATLTQNSRAPTRHHRVRVRPSVGTST